MMTRDGIGSNWRDALGADLERREYDQDHRSNYRTYYHPAFSSQLDSQIARSPVQFRCHGCQQDYNSSFQSGTGRKGRAVSKCWKLFPNIRSFYASLAEQRYTSRAAPVGRVGKPAADWKSAFSSSPTDRPYLSLFRMLCVRDSEVYRAAPVGRVGITRGRLEIGLFKFAD